MRQQAAAPRSNGCAPAKRQQPFSDGSLASVSLHWGSESSVSDISLDMPFARSPLGDTAIDLQEVSSSSPALALCHTSPYSHIHFRCLCLILLHF